MDKIINLGIPHVAEKIFEHLGMMDLNECLRVSETWKKIVGEVVVKRWKDYFCAHRSVSIRRGFVDKTAQNYGICSCRALT